MSEYIEISWTSGSIDEARKVARYLVQERLVACAQITPWVESIYLWDGKLETTQESQITFKTRHTLYDLVREVIVKNTSYQVPQITFTHMDGGNQEYLDWLNQTLKDLNDLKR